jgi:antagonist of KipI
MSFRMLRSGLLTTIQDLGRYGYQKFGVPVSGAMDPFALRIANLLVGNAEGDAALEMTMLGPVIEWENDALIAITGADLSATICGMPMPSWRPVLVKKGSVLVCGRFHAGCRAYLAVAGGLDVPCVMGSRSTYLRGGIGGYQGRALQAGDVLPVGRPSDRSIALMEKLERTLSPAGYSAAAWRVGTAYLSPFAGRRFVRVIPGCHYDCFAAESRQLFWQQAFQVSPQSDRMGYRLTGPRLHLAEPMELISEAVALGTVQVPPDGNPIILLADRQTTGGYPRIGQIATVDIPVVAQIRPGEDIRFVGITLAEAEQLYLAREKEIQELSRGISLK